MKLLLLSLLSLFILGASASSVDTQHHNFLRVLADPDVSNKCNDALTELESNSELQAASTAREAEFKAKGPAEYCDVEATTTTCKADLDDLDSNAAYLTACENADGELAGMWFILSCSDDTIEALALEFSGSLCVPGACSGKEQKEIINSEAQTIKDDFESGLTNGQCTVLGYDVIITGLMMSTGAIIAIAVAACCVCVCIIACINKMRS